MLHLIVETLCRVVMVISELSCLLKVTEVADVHFFFIDAIQRSNLSGYGMKL
jgi:hypothetical protein